jgi:hypothetical protein
MRALAPDSGVSIAQFLLLIIIIKLILLKIRVKTVKFQIYEWQRVIVSGADETRHWQWRVSKK